MKKYLTFFSPAKVNFFFKVLHKRDDGYHEIASIYQAINLGDIFDIRLSKRDVFRCNDPDLSFDSSNLIYKALELFRKKTALSFQVDIILKKNIPKKAGLGGGSSNAATILFAINELLNRPLSEEDLIELGKEIGSDVCFFFSSGSAYCTGRGEIFENIPLEKREMFIAFPSFGLSTPEVFKNLELSKIEKRDLQEVLTSFLKGNFQFFNDLESSAFSIEKKMNSFKTDLLEMGFKEVVMTGSGSAFICFGKPSKDLKKKEISLYQVESIQRNSPSWYPLFFSK